MFDELLEHGTAPRVKHMNFPCFDSGSKWHICLNFGNERAVLMTTLEFPTYLVFRTSAVNCDLR